MRILRRTHHRQRRHPDGGPPRGAQSGMRALQVFTAKPQFYNEKISVRPERIERFKSGARGDGDSSRARRRARGVRAQRRDA